MPTQTHSLQIGQIELTTINDGRLALPGAFFTNLPKGQSAGEFVDAGANLWVIRVGDRVILVDTGSAEALKARFPETGQAWDDLHTHAPTDIVLTHMHADHLGGFLDGSAFGDTRTHVARAEWEFWTNPALPDAVPEDRRPMVMMIQSVASGIADRVVLHDGQMELAPGVDLVGLPGHTPGHTGLRIRGGDQEVLIVADAIISEALQFASPAISYALDGDADQAIATRRSILQDAEQSVTILAATHFSFPGLWKVATEGDAYRFTPL